MSREPRVYAFGPYRIDPVRRALMRGDDTIRLTARVFDTLLYLVEHHERLVSRGELQEAVWQGRAVDENNLGQAISALRKALPADAGGNYVVTVAGRGYRFGVPVRVEMVEPDGAPAAGPPVPQEQSASLPHRGRLAVSRSLAIGAILCAAALLALRPLLDRHSETSPAPEPPPHAVAVLAFTNLTGDPAQAYLSDGIADQLINTLSRIDALQVTARTSAFSFRDAHATIRDIARKLNVTAVLEGSVSREGSHVHINMQLVRAATEATIWSTTYDGDLSDNLALQARVAASVAESLRAQILDSETTRLLAGGTHSSQALEAYLRGLKLFYDGETLGKTALGAFDEAIAADPNYALAHVRRSQALREVLQQSVNPEPGWKARYEDESVAEARKAIALAPDLAVAWAALGLALEEAHYDFKGAETAIIRAHALAPGDAMTNMADAYLQSHFGHVQEALQAALAVIRADPLAAFRYQTLAYMQTFGRQFDDALVSIRHSIQIEGHATAGDLEQICRIQYLKGQPEDSLKTAAGGKTWSLVYCQALALHKLGRNAEANAALNKLRAMLGEHGMWQYAEVYAQWGQTEAAQAWLDKAYRVGDPGLIELKVSPEVDPLRKTAAFKALLQRLDFPP